MFLLFLQFSKRLFVQLSFFFFNDTATTEIYTLSLHDALPIYMTPDRALDQALAAARSLGWTIMQRDRQEGRIEAMERTTWFGFTDDIVIRVRPESNGSRVDIRSVSRVGAGDTGTNAARVRK